MISVFAQSVLIIQNNLVLLCLQLISQFFYMTEVWDLRGLGIMIDFVSGEPFVC